MKKNLYLMVLEKVSDYLFNVSEFESALQMQEKIFLDSKSYYGDCHIYTLKKALRLLQTYFSLGLFKQMIRVSNYLSTSLEKLSSDDQMNFYIIMSQYYLKYQDNEMVLKILLRAQKLIRKVSFQQLIDFQNITMIYFFEISNKKSAYEIGYDSYIRCKKNYGLRNINTLQVISNLIILFLDYKDIRKYLIEYFDNILLIIHQAYTISNISARRGYLIEFNKVYKILKSCVFERKFDELLNYVFINKNLSFEIDVRRFHNEYLEERIGLDEVINKIDNRLIIDFYELEDNKYGLILIKKGSYFHYVVEYKDIIDGSFIEDNDFIGSVENYDHIYICPDGKLYNISFERIINNLNNISYLSSVQTLFQKREDEKTDNEEEMVSFVYPDFSGKISDDNDRGKNKGVLYGSYLEGMFIKEIYEDQASIYSLEKANHDNFFNTKRPHIFHVSTHGDYLENENLDPMDRGILCLSGYNKEEYKGYISAKQIQYMDLKNTELVVLSACNTGMGENIEGEGIYGIRRAFELAGCKTLLLTVEEIDDYNSAIFMKVFYERYRTNGKVYKSYKETKEYLKYYGIKELKELRNVFKEEMESKIKSRLIYIRNLKELDKRLEESEKLGEVVKRRGDEYIKEDWNGFIIQGLIEE